MARLDIKSLSSLQVSRHLIPRHDLIPNTSIQKKALLIYHSCIPASASASNIESHLYGFGGEGNPSRVEALVIKGDVIVVPAGVGHRLLDDFNSGFEMIGSYPRGENWDMCYGKAGEEQKVEGIHNLGWFDKDPLYGDKGPVLED
ncbi:hypothetical protein D0Z07_4332 [Hyphodiscus hymeniophilus]|uniref:Cupin type-1 domain-containing protein n=1 Tax=Hyphodiscus hymeniophilus TaxID=353542 RepID=A0A9P6VK87_9HELO|nr:hypothetical protein D0Z07_4332 [Hyphodiscus hymeniophilus]